MEIIGVLLERRPGQLVLCNGTRIVLKDGVSADDMPFGRTVTISCTVHGGTKVADDFRLNPDWLLEAIEATGGL